LNAFIHLETRVILSNHDEKIGLAEKDVKLDFAIMILI